MLIWKKMKFEGDGDTNFSLTTGNSPKNLEKRLEALNTITGTTTPGQSGPGSNGIEGLLHILDLLKWSLIRRNVPLF